MWVAYASYLRRVCHTFGSLEMRRIFSAGAGVVCGAEAAPACLTTALSPTAVVSATTTAFSAAAWVGT